LIIDTIVITNSMELLVLKPNRSVDMYVMFVKSIILFFKIFSNILEKIFKRDIGRKSPGLLREADLTIGTT